ncbi:MAG TPA: hypothetical protein VMM58_06260 [Bacteroidota bacterium]|nr:hypothetical protein [Bacteroidota bacterium]
MGEKPQLLLAFFCKKTPAFLTQLKSLGAEIKPRAKRYAHYVDRYGYDAMQQKTFQVNPEDGTMNSCLMRAAQRPRET